jgi:ABC-type branched-subunit amino acid transport system substrate-binding protein
MIKNGIIITLCSLTIFLLLVSIGVFQFGSFSENATFARFERERIRAVNSTPVWRVGFVNNETVGDGREITEGVRFSIERINAEGGILGKKVELMAFDTEGNFLANKYQVSRMSEDRSTAFLLAPYYTFEVPTTRAIVSFFTLPTVAPSVIKPESLPELSPDLFLTALPKIVLWTNPIVAALRDRGFKNVLVIGPAIEHMGGVFAAQIEGELRQDKHFGEVFRCSYEPPASYQVLYQSLKFYRDNRTFDVIVFTSTAEDLQVLGKVMKAAHISIPVYGMNILERADLGDFAGDFPAELIYTRTAGRVIDRDDYDEWIARFGKPPGQWAQYGILSCELFRDALEQNQSYSPTKLIETIQKNIEARNASGEYQLTVELTTFQK